MNAEQPPSTAAKKSSNATRAHHLFELAILFKGVDGALELIGGALAAFVPLSTLDNLIYLATAHELSLEPDDRIANALRNFADMLSIGTKHYAAAYLLSHGLLKLLLVYGLWREKTWAFPSALLFLTLFVAYQVYRYFHTGSPWLLVFAAVDTAVAWLIWREYERRKSLQFGA
jgi:uncharacterized membrane protein